MYFMVCAAVFAFIFLTFPVNDWFDGVLRLGFFGLMLWSLFNAGIYYGYMIKL